MNAIDNYILVEIDTVSVLTSMGEAKPLTVIKEPLRAYESKPRADEDLELLELVLPERKFAVREVAYIDR